MSRIIAVTGSTGQQGGAVARACLKAGWKVRGITRNVKSKGAQALAAEGAEMVVADIDDYDSLLKAFEGAYAVFALTNFWEHLGLGADAAGEKEAGQAYSVALAASNTPTLQHYFFSTLPSGKALSGGERPVPHMDHKANVDERIRKELPDLAAKTTFIWMAWYSANMAFFPVIRPFELPLSGGKWVWMQPCKADARLPIAGDVGNNLGVYVVAALAHPEKSRSKYIYVRTDLLSFTDTLKVWSEVSGKDAEYVPISAESFEVLWGPAGREMAMQYRSGELWDDWPTLKPDKVCSPEELGINKDQLVDFKAHLIGLKAHLTG